MKLFSVLLTFTAVLGVVFAAECFTGYSFVNKTRVTNDLPGGGVQEKDIIPKIEKQCCEGYRKSEAGNCDIVRCENCENGFCLFPDVCECNEGFIKDHRNGQCISESETTTPRLVMTKWMENSSPVSTTVPNHCGKDYVFNMVTALCEPYCESCVNGNCTNPGVCTCLPGYELQHESDGVEICVAICEQSCQNGQCVSPNKCQCHPGYKQSNETDICEPICEEDCTFGDCIAPNNCQCFPEYIWNDQIGGCELKRCTEENCKNGNCNETDICNCNEGYENNSIDECVPRCTMDNCVNGSCTEKGECNCYEGYTNVSRADKRTECILTCNLNCENGTQLSANSCECIEALQVSTDKGVFRWWFIAIMAIVVLVIAALSIGIGLRMVQTNMQSGTYRVKVEKVVHGSRKSILLLEEEAFV